MKWMQEYKRHENLTYLVLWGLLFAMPVLSLYLRTINDSSFAFHWSEVFLIWRLLAVYLGIFFLHNFLLAPLLVYRHKRILYFSTIAIVVALFFVYQSSYHPFKNHRRTHGKERRELVRAHKPNIEETTGFDRRPPSERRAHQGPRKGHGPAMIAGGYNVVGTIVLVLMLGMNIGIKLYFKSRHDDKQLMALEKENLEQQLEYLKYQINPHFFMNTLNNIHALVDIDPEKAKSTIVELSKMMRFILYEGDKRGVPLTREFDFIRNYITLMQLRYTDKVELKVELPTEAPDYELPPLMLITFIENAFKHGISYQHDSFVHVKATVENNQLLFLCSNSKTDKPNQEKGGVGLANVKKRLDLIYGSSYALNIQDNSDTYNIELEIPLT